MLLLLLVGTAQAQSRTLANIRGQVLAPGRINSNAIEVILEQSPNRVVGRTSTDNSGNFEFRSLEAGRYEVAVRLEGYHEFRQTVDIETRIEIPVEPVDGSDQPPPRVIGGDSGILDQALVYIVLTPVASGSLVDPELVALSRKYPRKIIQDYEKAQEENRKGNAAKAIERLEALLKEAPDFYSAHNDLGTLYQKQNRFRDAEREFKLARELSPMSALPLVNLGGMYLQEADSNLEKNPDLVGAILDDALDTLDEAVALEPHAAVAYYLLGTAYFKSAFFEEAEHNLKRALEMERSLGAARLMLINVYLRQESWQSALEHIDLYATENPNAPNRLQIQEIRSKVVESIGGDRR